MKTADELFGELRAASEGSPYTVTRTATGALVHLDVADLHWMSLLGEHRIDKEYSIDLVLGEAKHTYSREQIIRTMTWTAGLSGALLPTISASRSVQRGKSFELSGTQALDMMRNRGTAGYRFDSREMLAFVDTTMDASGWTKKMDRSSRIGLTVALSVLGGLLILGLIALIIVLAVT
jgi:hypothetical protein